MAKEYGEYSVSLNLHENPTPAPINEPRIGKNIFLQKETKKHYYIRTERGQNIKVDRKYMDKFYTLHPKQYIISQPGKIL